MSAYKKSKYQCDNTLVGCISRHFQEYMEADTGAEKRAVIKYIIDFAISTRVCDKKGSGESHPRENPRQVKHHYNNKATH